MPAPLTKRERASVLELPFVLLEDALGSLGWWWVPVGCFGLLIVSLWLLDAAMTAEFHGFSLYAN